METTRAYSLEKLTESGEFDTVAQRHAEYYRNLLEAAAAEPLDVVATNRHAASALEIDNVRAALNWSFRPGGNAADAVALAAASVALWLEMSLLTECGSWMDRAIAKLNDAAAGSTREEMALQTTLGLSLMYTHGGTSKARQALTRANELAKSVDDLNYRLRTLSALALCCIRLEDFRGALALAQRAEGLAGSGADAVTISTVDCITAVTLFFLGEYTQALTYALRGHRSVMPVERQAQIIRSGMDYSIMAGCFAAEILRLQGLLDQSARMARDVLADAEAEGHPASVCQALAWCGCRIPLESAIFKLPGVRRPGSSKWPERMSCVATMRSALVTKGYYPREAAIPSPESGCCVPALRSCGDRNMKTFTQDFSATCARSWRWRVIPSKVSRWPTKCYGASSAPKHCGGCPKHCA